MLRSVHGIPYNLWLPLPLSHRHWARVQGEAGWRLRRIARYLTNPGDVCGRPPYLRVSTAKVVFFFMGDIVARLNLDMEPQQDPSGCHRRQRRLRYPGENSETEEGKEEEEEEEEGEEGEEEEENWLDSNERRSTLRRASEKAIESYFRLLHLLLCLATGPDGEDIVAEANEMIRSFLGGRRGKDVLSLEHLFIAMHISDVQVTDELRKAIVTEAITRNVVRLLNGWGAGMAELGYLEADAVSHYRLKKTFEGSRTSYRLLMLSEVFRRVASPHLGGSAGGSDAKPPPPPPPLLVQIRDGLFARHGAPPAGAAAYLAAEVHRLGQIDAFPVVPRRDGHQGDAERAQLHGAAARHGQRQRGARVQHPRAAGLPPAELADAARRGLGSGGGRRQDSQRRVRLAVQRAAGGTDGQGCEEWKAVVFSVVRTSQFESTR